MLIDLFNIIFIRKAQHLKATRCVSLLNNKLHGVFNRKIRETILHLPSSRNSDYMNMQIRIAPILHSWQTDIACLD